jgi:cellulose synthase/poly-beta-1,6-N-acetylglucosamine synthase-like glycosyltransferase
MRVSAIVPTYRRPNDLKRCLEGLNQQQFPPDEILVIVRASDVDTYEFLKNEPQSFRLKTVEAMEPGQVAALNAGLSAATGEIVVITDDDTVPRPDWIARIEAHFKADAKLGGVGGRDVIHTSEGILEGKRSIAGRIQWFGRVIGNHHLSCNFQPSADVLKGANMAYRVEATGDFRFDSTLRGGGAQVCNDLAFSLAIKSKGWRLLYDPEVIVDHYPAVRFDRDQRGILDYGAVENAAFNMYWALARHMIPGPRRKFALIWEYWVGSVGRPGLLREFASKVAGRAAGLALAKAARAGRDQAAAIYAKRTHRS